MRTISLIALLVSATTAFAQRPPDIKLDAATNRQVAGAVVDAINKYYVSEEVAKRVDADLRRRIASGDYDRITSAFDLVDALDEHLEKVSRDPHLKIGYSHRGSPVIPGEVDREETAAERETARKEAVAINFGFDKVERLPGNIGYIDMNRFVRPDFSGNTTAAVMTFVANTEALIIDLRDSSGGSPDMVVFLASYFFGDEPFHLADMYSRVDGRAQQYWTLPYVPGSRYGKDLYILTSKRSFSAPEGLASFLQHHRRATIVGEKTRGGTHPGRFVKVHTNFALFVPMSWPVYPTGEPRMIVGRPVYPSSRADTQGTGVTPDIPAPAAQALKRAHLAALTKKVERDPSAKDDVGDIIDALKKELAQ